MNENGDIRAVLKKLHTIMSEVGYIQKDARNEHGKYNYASERAIKEALHAAFVEHDVLFLMDADPPTPVTDKFVSIPVRYRFYDIETGQCLSGTFLGTGHAREEKGTYAAITGAIKYILTTTFLIPTGDDAEGADQSGNGKKGKTTKATGKKPRTTPVRMQRTMRMRPEKKETPGK